MVKLNLQVNISLILLFIFIDIIGLLDIWNENIYRRMIHHMQSCLYNKNKIPWILFPNINLSNNEMKIIKECSDNIKKYNSVNTISPLILILVLVVIILINHLFITMI